MVRRAISEEAAREAHAWYMAESFRTLAQAATQYGLNRESLRLKAHTLDLPMKARGPEKNGPDRPKCTSYNGILEAYRAGTSVEKLSIRLGLRADAIVEILRAGGEACARCKVLLREHTPYGIAVLANGRRVCQECVEEAHYQVVRWDRPPVEIVRDYCEISDVYAWQGER